MSAYDPTSVAHSLPAASGSGWAMPAQRVDQLRLLGDQHLAHPVDRQGALRLRGLDRHEAHARPLHGLAAFTDIVRRNELRFWVWAMMTILLRDALHDFATGWKADLLESWASVLAEVEPDQLSVRNVLALSPTKPFFPSHRAKPLSRAPAGAHTFRAFDGLQRDHVRCVLLRQNPYLRIDRAAGRSFEQGDLLSWLSEETTAKSLRTLVRFLAHANTGRGDFLQAGGWPKIQESIASRESDLGTPRDLFDHWQASGVLYLKAKLTMARYLQGAPPSSCTGISPSGRLSSEPCLAMSLSGQNIQSSFFCLAVRRGALTDAMKIRASSETAGTWKRRVDDVRLAHLATPAFSLARTLSWKSTGS